MESYIYRLTLQRPAGRWDVGALYIGKHGGTNLNYYTGGTIPKAFIKKYGRKVFKREIIVRGNFNDALLSDLEKHYIRLYNSKNCGLNLTDGGDGMEGACKEVYQFNSDGSYLRAFTSAKEAAKAVGSFAANINAAASGVNHKGCKGYYWSYIKSNTIEPRRWATKSVRQFTTDGDLVGEFSSVALAARETGTSASAISSAAGGNGKSAGGFQWSYTAIESMPPLITYWAKYDTERIYSYNDNGCFLNEYENWRLAYKDINPNKPYQKSHIVRVVDKENRTWMGVQLRSYKVDNCGKLNPSKSRRKCGVRVYDLNHTLIAEFPSYREAAKLIGRHESVICPRNGQTEKVCNNYLLKYVG